jgi:hypothetical protein
MDHSPQLMSWENQNHGVHHQRITPSKEAAIVADPIHLIVFLGLATQVLS